MKPEAKLKRVRASVVCVRDAKLLVVRLKDPVSQKIYAFPPGGSIEKNESPWQAAEREALEETRTHVKVDRTSEKVHAYDFFWRGKTFECVTHFFRAEFISYEKEYEVVEVDWVGLDWIPLNHLDDTINYHPEILRAVKSLL